MKCISLWQPWASLLAHGIKKIETRDWDTNVRGVVAIHASKRWTREEKEYQDWDAFRVPLADVGFDWLNPPLGVILGTARLVRTYRAKDIEDKLDRIGINESTYGCYGEGRFGWFFDEFKPFDVPIPAKGKQGWWDADLRLCPTCGQLSEPGIAHCTECQFSAVAKESI